ncbi:MAG: HAMP domain-containing sensor histidine kinase, partial [Hyphomicrobium sp.]
ARSTAESLAFAKTDAQRDELVHQIQLELKRLNRLITDVSKASRLDAELARQHIEPVALVTVLENVVAAMRERATSRGCNLALDIGGGISSPSSFIVEGNDSRIGQVLTNLVDNAISFSPNDGQVLLSARRSGPNVEIAVEDDGPGIDEDKLSTIFDRFYTYRPTANSSRGDNSGLGLSISREIVKAHGGEIRAENRYASGRSARQAADRLGARFVVTFPAARTTPITRGGHGLGRRS